MENIKKVRYYSGMWLLTRDKKVLEIRNFGDKVSLCIIDREPATVDSNFLCSCVPLPFQKGDMVEYAGGLVSVLMVEYVRPISNPKGYVLYTILQKGHLIVVRDEVMNNLKTIGGG